MVKFADTQKQKQARLQRQRHAAIPSTAGAASAHRRGQKQACEGNEKGYEPDSDEHPIDLKSLLEDWNPLVEGPLPITPQSSFWMDFTFLKNAFGSLSFSASDRMCVTKDTITHSEYYEMNAVTDNVSGNYLNPIVGSMHPHLQLPRGNNSGNHI